MKATATIHEKFEVWPASSEEAKRKRVQTNVEKYGADNPAKNDEVKQRVSEGLLHRYAIDGDDIKGRAQQTYFEKTGYRTPAQNPDVQRAVRERNKQKYGTEDTFSVPEFKAKADATNLERYGTIVPMQNKDIWAKQKGQKSQHAACDGTLLDSSYEVDVYNFCAKNNIPISRTIPIEFEYEGKNRRTFIDFNIDGLLIEVKGEHMLEGYFDSQPDAVPIAKKLEIYRKHHVIVITGQTASHFFENSNGLNYLSKCADPLIGIDIELFRKPQFPYRENRPKCFYNVQVNGQRSSFEAFHDEKLRWEMIKNRINYVGGFISSKEILTALNVTRRCKQPSWFSLTYAEYILNKYSTSDTIVDPLAGWGTRHDAAVKLHKHYIGCDLNAELVEWHWNKGRNIVLCDAKEFKYDGPCDVFICPPYKDTEIYFDGQDCNTTQCEWLEIIRKNVPNANRYIMVCKDVDPGYEQYVVETKENRSHFGNNTEYVLVIST